PYPSRHSSRPWFKEVSHGRPDRRNLTGPIVLPVPVEEGWQGILRSGHQPGITKSEDQHG
ncbi:MAG TPA: hypothetical protein VN203_20700, partial [Candidatus Acidoferrum sp.]|nr:hypothetical protein [Candidatus Acidoferrum sp.]